MNWIVLFIAGVFEVAMTFCLGKTKGAQGTELYLWIGGFVLATVLSMGLLAKAVQTLPIGTAYAIWTGVGALGFLNSTVVGAVSEYICRFGRCIRAKIDGMTTVRSIGV